jgi:hypothetical protein
MPSHMLHSLSKVASQTPHYPHTPGYGGQSAYINTVSIFLKFYFSVNNHFLLQKALYT